jgi:hypothetical protein
MDEPAQQASTAMHGMPQLTRMQLISNALPPLSRFHSLLMSLFTFQDLPSLAVPRNPGLLFLAGATARPSKHLVYKFGNCSSNTGSIRTVSSVV